MQLIFDDNRQKITFVGNAGEEQTAITYASFVMQTFRGFQDETNEENYVEFSKKEDFDKYKELLIEYLGENQLEKSHTDIISGLMAFAERIKNLEQDNASNIVQSTGNEDTDSDGSFSHIGSDVSDTEEHYNRDFPNLEGDESINEEAPRTEHINLNNYDSDATLDNAFPTTLEPLYIEKLHIYPAVGKTIFRYNNDYEGIQDTFNKSLELIKELDITAEIDDKEKAIGISDKNQEIQFREQLIERGIVEENDIFMPRTESPEGDLDGESDQEQHTAAPSNNVIEDFVNRQYMEGPSNSIRIGFEPNSQKYVITFKNIQISQFDVLDRKFTQETHRGINYDHNNYTNQTSNAVYLQKLGADELKWIEFLAKEFNMPLMYSDVVLEKNPDLQQKTTTSSFEEEEEKRSEPGPLAPTQEHSQTPFKNAEPSVINVFEEHGQVALVCDSPTTFQTCLALFKGQPQPGYREAESTIYLPANTNDDFKFIKYVLDSLSSEIKIGIETRNDLDKKIQNANLEQTNPMQTDVGVQNSPDIRISEEANGEITFEFKNKEDFDSCYKVINSKSPLPVSILATGNAKITLRNDNIPNQLILANELYSHLSAPGKTIQIATPELSQKLNPTKRATLQPESFTIPDQNAAQYIKIFELNSGKIGFSCDSLETLRKCQDICEKLGVATDISTNPETDNQEILIRNVDTDKYKKAHALFNVLRTLHIQTIIENDDTLSNKLISANKPEETQAPRLDVHAHISPVRTDRQPLEDLNNRRNSMHGDPILPPDPPPTRSGPAAPHTALPTWRNFNKNSAAQSYAIDDVLARNVKAIFDEQKAINPTLNTSLNHGELKVELNNKPMLYMAPPDRDGNVKTEHDGSELAWYGILKGMLKAGHKYCAFELPDTANKSINEFAADFVQQIDSLSIPVTGGLNLQDVEFAFQNNVTKEAVLHALTRIDNLKPETLGLFGLEKFGDKIQLKPTASLSAVALKNQKLIEDAFSLPSYRPLSPGNF